MGNFVIQDCNIRPIGKPRKRWEGVVQMEEMSRRQRRMEWSSEGGQGPEEAVRPYMDEWI
jgi:hypothetical protein